LPQKNTDAVTCVSEPTRKRLHQLFPSLNPQKTSVVPNSVSVSNSSSDTPLPEPLQNFPFLLCVAQHRANKNLPLLLRAFRLALDHDVIPPTFKLVIVGNEGPETETLHRTVAESHLSSRVLFLRDISDPLLATLYASCELFIAPSLLEGFGLPVAEALAAGCRIACSDIPAFRSLAPANAAFFDPTDLTAASLLAAIKQALKAPRPQAILPSGLDTRQAADMYFTFYSQLTLQRSTTLLAPANLSTTGDL
jgi:glycosyltransferase involved in cell wall biosynthesis